MINYRIFVKQNNPTRYEKVITILNVESNFVKFILKTVLPLLSKRWVPFISRIIFNLKYSRI